MIRKQRCKSSSVKKAKNKMNQNSFSQRNREKQKQQLKSILSQIQSLTQKIQKASIQQNKKRSLNKRRCSMLQKTQKKEQISERQYYPIQNIDFTFQSQNSQKNKKCNQDCYKLVQQYQEMVKQNRKLMETNEQLQKKLYFESKQKRQLRWKLQKIYKHEKMKIHRDFLNYSQNINLFQNTTSNISVPNNDLIKTKQKQYRRKKRNKQNKLPTQDILCDRTEHYAARENNKQNNQIFQYMKNCSDEKDQLKKAFIRKQMLSIAQKLKKIDTR